MQTHELDFVQTGASSRTLKMRQSTQAMEDQYLGMLTNIVKSGSWKDPQTGNPWSPNASFFEPIREVINSLKTDLTDEHNTNEEIMQNATNAITAVNTARDTRLSGVVLTKKNQMISDRGTHNTCRVNENTAISTMEASCEAFHQAPRCRADAASPAHEQDWYAGADEGDSSAGGLLAVVQKAVTCKADIGTATSKAGECDQAQNTFTTAWCDYKDELSDTCSVHETDWTAAKANWVAANHTIHSLESEQKIIYRMLGRIECYITWLEGGAERAHMPTAGDIETCKNSVVTDTPLDVDRHTTAATIDSEKGVCESSTWTGDESIADVPENNNHNTWYGREFGDNLFTSHDKLVAGSACSS